MQKIATGQRNSSALRKHTPVVLVADADSHIKFGDSSVTADTNDFLLPAKVPMRFFTLRPGPLEETCRLLAREVLTP